MIVYNKDFNKKVKEFREKNNLSQEGLANLSGLSLRTIQRIENGGAQQTYINGKTTTIKRSYFGKSDTTIVYESMDDLLKNDPSLDNIIRRRE